MIEVSTTNVAVTVMLVDSIVHPHGNSNLGCVQVKIEGMQFSLSKAEFRVQKDFEPLSKRWSLMISTL